MPDDITPYTPGVIPAPTDPTDINVIIEEEDINVILEEDSVILVELLEGLPGEKGEKGDPGTPGTGGGGGGTGVLEPTTYVQNTASNNWVFAHQYPYRPVVVIYNNNGAEIEADVSHPMPGIVSIKFAYGMTGMVQLF